MQNRPLFYCNLMDKTKQDRKIFRGTGYVLGLLIGIAIMIAFALGFGATFFGITLGLSLSLCIGTGLECAIIANKYLARFQKILLLVSCILLILSVFFLFYFEEMLL